MVKSTSGEWEERVGIFLDNDISTSEELEEKVGIFLDIGKSTS